MKISDEKNLAHALMNKESRIEITDDLSSGVKRILSPSDIVLKPILAVIGTMIGILGLAGAASWVIISYAWPAVCTISGGIGGFVAVVLGYQGADAAVKLAYFAKDVNVLIILRKNYSYYEENMILIRK